MKENNFKRWFIISIVVLLGFIIRTGYLLAPRMDSDHAIFALQGMHILKGDFPVFSWGTAYMGTLQSYLDAVLFYLFGPSREIFCFAASFFYIGYGFSLFYLSRALFKNFYWQLAVVVIGVISPEYFSMAGMYGRHGYPETYFFGTLLLAMICNSVGKPKSGKFYFLLGLISGIAFWVNFLIIYYFSPVGVYLIYQIYKFKNKLVRCFFSTLAGFLLGSFPLLYFNLKNNFISFDMFAPSAGASLVSKMYYSVYKILPYLLGLKHRGDDYYIYFVWYPFFLFYIGAIVFFIFYFGIKLVQNLKDKKIEPFSLLWIFFVTLPGVFWISHSSDNNTLANMRYLLPFYSVYPVMTVCFIFYLEKVFRKRGVSIFLFSSVLIINLISNAIGNPFVRKDVRDEFNKNRRKRDKLFSDIKKTGKKDFLMLEYWKAPLYTFDTAEEMIFAFVNTRKPEYVYDILDDKSINYLILSKEKDISSKRFENLGYEYQIDNLDEYDIFHSFTKKYDLTSAVLPSEDLEITVNEEDLEILKHMSDRNITTSYSVFFNESDTVSFEVNLKKIKKITGFIFYLYGKKGFFGGNIIIKDIKSGKVLLSTDKGVYKGMVRGGHPYILNHSPYFELYIEPYDTEGVQIIFESLNKKDVVTLRELMVLTSEKEMKHDNIKDIDKIILKALEGEKLFEIFCTPSRISKYSDLFKKKIRYSRVKYKDMKIDFNKKNLFVFEKEFRAFNERQLTDLGIDFNSFEDDIYAYIVTINKEDMKALWCEKAILNYNNRIYSKDYYDKALKALKNKDKLTAGKYLKRALLFLSTHFYALKELEKIAKEKNDTETLKEIQSSIKKMFSPNILCEIDFENNLKYLGIKADIVNMKAGDILPITYYFLPTEKVKNDFYVFVYFSVHGEVKNMKILFQNDHLLDDGSETKVKYFIPNEMIIDKQNIAVPMNLGFKGKVDVWIGLWDPKKKKRFRSETMGEDRSNRCKIAEFNIN
ncbi:MAG: hypothetical protein KAI43_14350 [Candidatus Aureabacteria bacterium]|nr:hypothetical protein [Candidatus Auribacterota bacterium]